MGIGRLSFWKIFVLFLLILSCPERYVSVEMSDIKKFEYWHFEVSLYDSRFDVLGSFYTTIRHAVRVNPIKNFFAIIYISYLSYIYFSYILR